jgi:hypothetical protein
LEIEEDQVVAVLAMKLTNLARIGGRRYGNIAGITQHLFKQNNICLVIVNDQDAALKNVR